tara:strand:+ start:7576 stop:8442 length:867 start_codon:yes stop_codon:yes gene_type:complete
MKLLILYLSLISIVAFSSIAPEFPEPYQFFDQNSHAFDEIGYVFNRKNTFNPSRIGATLVHQNREWGYNWFLFGFVMPMNQLGVFSFGYSNYGSNAIPITTSDSVSASIYKYSSDTFENLVFSYEPLLSFINMQLIGGYKIRRLIDQKATALTGDINLTSKYVLKNQLGIRTRNLISQRYQWSNTAEDLAKYASVYFIQPISSFIVVIEQNLCLNYDDLNMLMVQGSLALDDSMSIFASYRKDNYHSQLSFGSYIQLSGVFNLGYTNKNEVNENLDLSIHSVSIGVKF